MISYKVFLESKSLMQSFKMLQHFKLVLLMSVQGVSWDNIIQVSVDLYLYFTCTNSYTYKNSFLNHIRNVLCLKLLSMRQEILLSSLCLLKIKKKSPEVFSSIVIARPTELLCNRENDMNVFTK